MLRHQHAARLRLAQLLLHAFQRPAHRRTVRFRTDVHHRRQHPQQDAGMVAIQREVAADRGERAAAVEHGDAAGGAHGKDRAGIDRRKAQVAGEAERPAVGQQEAVPRAEPHRVRYPIHRQPAFAGRHRVALDAVAHAEADRPGCAGVETADHVAARPQQRQHVRQRVHGLFLDDREGEPDPTAWTVPAGVLSCGLGPGNVAVTSRQGTMRCVFS